ncbi:uncharacterized protein JN550_010233 [Neoarthrinium moseri]|uniref:uncharacterized protein n=1 Tax=Neoarthrinium moseri TaxID=1658444 RepID=UPI001FDAD6F9|nr:uncharacterized protein JN550_010233 [Neoarthrinium moseri]KAI1862371.1 hypothetical protein JN550_010233 [Neoarthrinium moseri]
MNADTLAAWRYYWDEVNKVSELLGSDLWKSEYFSGDGEGGDNCIQTGPYINLTLRWELNGRVEDHCVTRHNSRRSVNAAAQTSIDQYNVIDSFATACSFLEGSPHSAGHSGRGRDFQVTLYSVFTTPSLIVSWEWHKLDPEHPLYDMAGLSRMLPNDPSIENAIVDYFNDNGTETTLSHTPYMDALAEPAPNVTIYCIMDLNERVICSEHGNA